MRRFTTPALLLLVSLATTPLLPAAVPTVKAKVEEPVLEELMGGCSLQCAFRWTVQVTEPGGKPTATQILNDESALSAWIARTPGRQSGIGTKLKLAFPRKLLPAAEGNTPVFGLDLIN